MATYTLSNIKVSHPCTIPLHNYFKLQAEITHPLYLPVIRKDTFINFVEKGYILPMILKYDSCGEYSVKNYKLSPLGKSKLMQYILFTNSTSEIFPLSSHQTRDIIDTKTISRINLANSIHGLNHGRYFTPAPCNLEYIKLHVERKVPGNIIKLIFLIDPTDKHDLVTIQKDLTLIQL